MGLLLKIALIGLAIYAVWKTFHRWKGLYDRFVGGPAEKPMPPPQPPAPNAPAQPAPEPAARRSIEDAQTCRVCGAFFTSGAGKCGQPNCPLP